MGKTILTYKLFKIGLRSLDQHDLTYYRCMLVIPLADNFRFSK